MAQDTEDPQILRASDTVDETSDGNTGQIVRETRTAAVPANQANQTEVVRSVSGLRAERRARALDRFGGFYWGSDFIGFAVASFFTIVFLGIVGAIVGAVGYQLNTPVPKIGGHLSGATQNLGIGALVGTLIAVFLAYVIGGYTASRMARYSGTRNGLGVWIWTIIVAVLLAIAGAALGSSFNVASQIHLNVNRATLTTASAISVAVTLVVMLIGALLGGMMGERYNRGMDREVENL